VPLAVTLIRTPDWQAQRKPRHGGIALALWLGLPAVFLVGSVIAYRVYEIPVPPPAVQPVKAPRLIDSVDTKKLWLAARRACPNFSAAAHERDMLWRLQWLVAGEAKSAELDADDRETIDNGRRAISLALAAARRGPALIGGEPDAFVPSSGATWISLAELLLLSARDLESQNELSDAETNYRAALRLGQCLTLGPDHEQWLQGRAVTFLTLRAMQSWADHPMQTTQRVRTLLGELASLAHPSEPLSRILEAERQRLTRPNHQQLVAGLLSNAEPSSLRAYLPWEAAREDRLADAVLHAAIIGATAAERDLAERRWTSQRSGLNAWHQMILWLKDNLIRTPSLRMGDWLPALDLPLEVVNGAAREEMLAIAIAAASYKREHGELPASLTQLQSEYVVNCVDPWTGLSLVYEPRGVSNRIGSYVSIEAGVPFLLSAGWLDCRLVETRTPTIIDLVPTMPRSFWSGLATSPIAVKLPARRQPADALRPTVKRAARRTLTPRS
jgi:hypothetical protein